MTRGIIGQILACIGRVLGHKNRGSRTIQIRHTPRHHREWWPSEHEKDSVSKTTSLGCVYFAVWRRKSSQSRLLLDMLLHNHH